MAERIRLGLPRALLYYWFAPLWEAFFGVLGVRPIVSPETNKALLGLGLKAALDDVCLPVKLFLGHAAYLSAQCDVLMVPHLISLENRAFTCPKFMGLPDLVRQALPGARTMTARVDIRGGATWEMSAREAAAALGFRGGSFLKAWRAARAAQAEYGEALRSGTALGLPPGTETGPNLAVLGHPYCLYDRFINMDLLNRLAAAGCRVITPEMLPASAIEEGLAYLPKSLFWSFGRRQLGAAYHLLGAGRCDGIVHATAFACGPEALVGELAEKAAARWRVPMLRLHLDEHTGEAGFLTRLEAFLDMIGRWRR
ncbi:MAG: acyl-CoA dehydratase activase-related protein [Bacteroidota bacterium]